ncbi:MAG: hypothetical protein K1X36_12150 [Pyrinomonadaceae bacterium]|nr:hypothetical protein [Pyrinomonadaceae bacterium]
METLVKFGTFVAAFIVGIVIGAFLLGNIVLTTSYGIPLSIRLKNLGLIADYRPAVRNFVTFLVNCVLVAITTLLVVWYFPNVLSGFLFGLGLIVLKLSGDNVRFSSDNQADYIEANSGSFIRDPQSLTQEEMNYFFNLRESESIQGNQLFARVCGELVSNILFFGVLTNIILIAGRISWWIGIVFAILFTVFTLLSSLQTMILVITAPIGIFIQFFSKHRNEVDRHGRLLRTESRWMVLATIPRLFELGFDVIYILTLYWFFFPVNLD